MSCMCDIYLSYIWAFQFFLVFLQHLLPLKSHTGIIFQRYKP